MLNIRSKLMCLGEMAFEIDFLCRSMLIGNGEIEFRSTVSNSVTSYRVCQICLFGDLMEFIDLMSFMNLMNSMHNFRTGFLWM